MKLIILGAPGAGKGTQATMLAEKLKITHISTGDIFRQNIKSQTELGIKANEFIAMGQLVPDYITNKMVFERLLKDDCKKGYLLDGYPRNLPQAEELATVSDIDCVINLLTVNEELVKRISSRRICTACNNTENIAINDIDNCSKCNSKLSIRDDDKPETVLERLQVYDRQTSPLIQYYTKKNLLLNVDAIGKIEDVFYRICSSLKL